MGVRKWRRGRERAGEGKRDTGEGEEEAGGGFLVGI